MRPAEEGLAVAKQRTRALQQEFGADHEETLMAESMVASFTLHCGRHSEARILYQQLTGRAASTLGDNHRLVLGLEFGLASSIFASGAYDEGLPLLEAAVRKSISTLGAGDLTVLDRRKCVVQLLMEAGRNGDALERLTALETDCTHLPAMHPITVSVRRMASQLHHHQS